MEKITKLEEFGYKKSIKRKIIALEKILLHYAEKYDMTIEDNNILYDKITKIIDEVDFL